MKYTNESIKQLIEQACDMLIKNDSQLFENGVNERTLTHRLAVYLESLFPEWNVDCEYNKNKGLNKHGDVADIPKRVFSKYPEESCSNDTNGKTVYPDIIIHQRGTNENIVVIEAKKDNDNRKNGINYDILKLKAYKEELNYEYPFFLIFQLTEKKYKLLTLEEAQQEYEIPVRNRH